MFLSKWCEDSRFELEPDWVVVSDGSRNPVKVFLLVIDPQNFDPEQVKSSYLAPHYWFFQGVRTTAITCLLNDHLYSVRRIDGKDPSWEWRSKKKADFSFGPKAPLFLVIMCKERRKTEPEIPEMIKILFIDREDLEAEILPKGEEICIGC